jgi:hypothetical protein
MALEKWLVRPKTIELKALTPDSARTQPTLPGEHSFWLKVD